MAPTKKKGKNNPRLYINFTSHSVRLPCDEYVKATRKKENGGSLATKWEADDGNTQTSSTSHDEKVNGVGRKEAEKYLRLMEKKYQRIRAPFFAQLYATWNSD